MTVLVQRSVVQCQVGETKTEGSFRPLPVDPGLAARLRDLRVRSAWPDAGGLGLRQRGWSAALAGNPSCSAS
jgi:hypothetical protein